jgi:polyhydroxybutyrate depolymerase
MNKRLVISVLTGFYLASSLFCSAQTGVTYVDSIFSNGVYRKFRTYVPNIYNVTTLTPLVINLHGYGSNSLQQQSYGNFMPIADTANFIIVHPDGLTLFGSPFWNAGITSTPNDVQFISNLIDYLKTKFAIDTKRIYSCGMSNGGIMSYYLACNLSNRIAAIASVTGSMFQSWFESCSPARPFPIIEIHGTDDSTVPYDGVGSFSSIDSVIKKWVKNNNCNSTAITYSVPNTNSADNSYAVNYKYTGGNLGSSVELYKVFGGSHSWPGAPAIFANTNLDFNASAEIWRFFRQYNLTQFSVPLMLTENNWVGNIHVFPNPTSDVIHVNGITDENATYSVFSIDGKQLTSETSVKEVSIAHLNKGIYFLRIKKANSQHIVKIAKD